MVNNIDILIKAKDEASSKLDALTKKLSKLQNIRGMKKLSNNVSITTKKVSQLNLEIKKLSQSKGLQGWLKKGQNAMIGFNGAALSSLFFGMALQRVFGGALKSIFEGYKKIIPEGHAFNVLTTKLSANWEFFKFQLADALSSSPLFQSFIGYLINMVQWLQKLSAPTKLFIVAISALGAAFGTLMVASATTKLGLAGISDGMMLINSETGKFSWGKLKTFGFLILAGIAIYGLKSAMDAFSDSSEVAEGKQKILSDTIKNSLMENLKDLADLFTFGSLELENWGEVGVYWATAVRQTFIGFMGILNTGMFLLRELFNAFTILVRLAISPFIDIIVEAALAVSYLFELMNDTDYSGIRKNIKSIGFAFVDVEQDVQDMVDAWGDQKDAIDGLIDASMSPSDAVTEYRNELQKLNDDLEQQKKSENFINDLFNQEGVFKTNLVDGLSSQIPAAGTGTQVGTTTTNYVTIVDSVQSAYDAGFIDQTQYDAYNSLNIGDTGN